MDCTTETKDDVISSGFDQGTLEETPLPALLTTLAEQGTTGVVRLEISGEVWLDAGRIYLASTASSPELSNLLFDAKLGNRDEIEQALRADSALDRMLDKRPESGEVVARLLHEYTLNSLFEMLVPSTESYSVDPDVVHPIGPRFAEDTATVIDQAAHRVEIWRRIAARIPSTGAVFTLAEALPARVDERMVTADEWRFLSRLNGINTVADVINQTGESAFRVCSSLYRLLLEDLIEEATGLS